MGDYRGKFATANGFNMFECASAVQKSIRRGMVEEAVFWGVELDVSNYGAYLWKRLRVIASEDVGLADPQAAATVRALYDNWLDLYKKDQDADRLFTIQAIVYLATCPKSRVIDSLTLTYYSTQHITEAETKEIPEWMLDHHTRRGRQMGRDETYFFEVSTQLDRTKLEPQHPLRDEIAAGEDHWALRAQALKEAGVESMPKRAKGGKGDPQMFDQA